MRLNVKRIIRIDSDDPLTAAIPRHDEPAAVEELGARPLIMAAFQRDNWDEEHSGREKSVGE
jgi:hypothetical protein